MRWTALVPLKTGGEGKSRLASCLGPAARALLIEQMAAHVLRALRQAPEIARVLVLAEAPVPALGAGWADDRGLELNRALCRWRAGLAAEPLLVVHADLPFLGAGDVSALLAAAARAGAAIAPDRAHTGTNALALARCGRFAFAFGPGSYARHRSLLGVHAASARRAGLAFDVDTPRDLAAARRQPRWRREYAL